MKIITIIVEDDEVEAITNALEHAEDEGEITSAFTVKVDDTDKERLPYIISYVEYSGEENDDD